ncbi:MAG: tetratricopeptide repeat protein [Bacteroidia bacterium]|nr:tetratricopeptide repeat protein [Bacteroidia bacterium]
MGDQSQKYHQVLAEYLAGKPLYLDENNNAKPNVRKLAELPWHWLQAKCWLNLYQLLIDWKFFITLWDSAQFDVKRYWTQLEKNSSHKICEGYQPVIKNIEIHTLDTWRLAELLQNFGHLCEAEQIYIEEIKHFEDTNDQKRLAATLTSLALVSQIQGNLESAIEACARAERIYQTIDDDFSFALLAETLGIHAIVLEQQGDYKSALIMHQKAEQICRKFKVTRVVAGVANAIEGQARVHMAKGDFQVALKLLRENETLCREAGQLEGLQRCFGDQALVLLKLGLHSEAIAASRDKMQLCESLGFLSGVAYAFGIEGAIHEKRRDYSQALAAYVRSTDIFRKINESSGLAISIYNQSRLVTICGGTLADAKKLHDEAILIATTNGFTSMLAQMDPNCLRNQMFLSKSWLVIKIVCVWIHWLLGFALVMSLFTWPSSTISSVMDWKIVQILVATFLIVEGEAYKRTVAIQQCPEAFRFAGINLQTLGVGLASYVTFCIVMRTSNNDYSSILIRLMILILWYLPIFVASLWAMCLRKKKL